MSKMVWFIACIAGRKMNDPRMFSIIDRLIVELFDVMTQEMPNIDDLQGRIAFKTLPSDRFCFHFFMPIRCAELSGMYVIDRNDFEVVFHIYTIVVCPFCQKTLGEIEATHSIVQKKSIAAG